MFLQKFFLLIIIILLTNIAGGATNEAEPSLLGQKLSQLTAKYPNKVGLAFIDLKSGRQFDLNGQRPFPSASVIKLAVMACVFHRAESDLLDLNKKLIFHEQDKVGGAGVLQWLKGNQGYTIWNLTRMMISLSDNTATRLLVNYLTPTAINAYAQRLGLTQTVIKDPSMLAEPPAANTNYTSPVDTAVLLKKIALADGFSPSSQKQMLGFMHNQRYRWGIPRGIFYTAKVANKTGQLEHILNDAGIVYAKNGTYVLAVFTWGFTKQKNARMLINDISRLVYEDYTGKKVSPPKAKKAKKAKKAPKKRKYSKKRKTASFCHLVAV